MNYTTEPQSTLSLKRAHCVIMTGAPNDGFLLRDRPLEKLWGGGEFSIRRNFFSLSDSLYELFLGHSMNIF